MEKFRSFLKKSVLVLVIVSVVFLPFYLMNKNDKKNFQKFRDTGDPYYVSEEFARGYNYGRSDAYDDIRNFLDDAANDTSECSHIESSVMNLLSWFDEPTKENFDFAYSCAEDIRYYVFSILDLQSSLDSQ